MSRLCRWRRVEKVFCKQLYIMRDMRTCARDYLCESAGMRDDVGIAMRPWTVWNIVVIAMRPWTVWNIVVIASNFFRR